MCKMNWAQGELKVAGEEKETRRKEQRKNGLGQITKPFTPTQAIYVHIDEERKETGSGPPTQLPHTTHMDQVVGLFWTPPSHRRIFIIIE